MADESNDLKNLFSDLLSDEGVGEEIVEEAPSHEIAEELLDKVVKVPEVSSRQLKATEKQELKEEIKKILITRGDEKWEIPEDAEMDVSTKSGKTGKAKLKEAKDDYWGKSESSKRINEATELANKQRQFEAVTQYVQDEIEVRGFDRVWGMLKAAVEVNPSLKEDIKHFEATLVDLINRPENEKTQFWLQAENQALRRQAEQTRKAIEPAKLMEYSGAKANHMSETLNVSIEEMAAMAKSIEKSLPKLATKVDVDQAYNILATHIHEKRIQSVLSDLKLSEKDQGKAIEEMVGSVTVRPSISREELKEKVLKILDIKLSPKQKLARKAEQYERSTGHKPSRPETKPVKKDETAHESLQQKLKRLFETNG